MAGHSKWAQIKRKKGVKDKARGQIFSKHARLITLAVVEGGGITDPALNVKLRLAIERARADNMPKDNIERAIARGIGPDRAQIREVFYEAFGPGGVMLMIQATTDNPNRTLSEIRNTVERQGGKLGAQGSVAYIFTKCALMTFEKSANDEDQIFDFASRIGALDIEEDQTSLSVYIPFDTIGRVKENLGSLTPASGPELDFKASSVVTMTSQHDATHLLSLIEAVESLDDVAQVFGNFDIPEEYLEN